MCLSFEASVGSHEKDTLLQRLKCIKTFIVRFHFCFKIMKTISMIVNKWFQVDFKGSEGI